MKRKLSKKRIWILVAVLGPPGLALFMFLVGKLVMSLWNWLLPPLFGPGDHLLAGPWVADAMPDSLRRIWIARFGFSTFPFAQAGGAGTGPPSNVRTIGHWPSHRREWRD